MRDEHERVPAASARARAAGKFLAVGDEKLYVRGVTYGTFAPAGDGVPLPPKAVVDRDFAAMAARGVNAVRVYTPPPPWLLDLAGGHGLLVLAGLAWEEHVAFLDERGRARAIVDGARRVAAPLAGHPALLGFAVGNEIPASIVRWHGRRKIERFLERLCEAVKSEDPAALVTYANYPSTEYLQLPFLDFATFNVYLEEPRELDRYLARLQTLAGDKPLLVGELGLDSRRHGLHEQASAIERQVETTFAAGATGVFVFSWTDEWYRGGVPIEDWDFGLTTRQRAQKPALATVERAFRSVPFGAEREWPRASVVICSHNGAATIRDALVGAVALDYPDYELIVVDDGSSDSTGALAEEFGARVIRTANQGLSSARNTGIAAATGEIVAFLDDDAVPDRHWLRYLASAFGDTEHAGIGGPNVSLPAAGLVPQAIAHAPGGPTHVLLSDREAEHIPGCNMAFRRDALEAVRGFDPRFRVAGDDVDLCWRLQARGETLGFSAGAMVWHRRRESIRAYLRQQREYGKAEALLERKWPGRYNRPGHLTWAGRVYARTPRRSTVGIRPRVRYGRWGTGLFQSLYAAAPQTAASLALMPEVYVLVAVLGALSLHDYLRRPVFAVPVPFALFCAVATVVLAQALRSSWLALPSPPAGLLRRACLRGLIALLHVLQPGARLVGRMRHGLTPWRRRGLGRVVVPLPRTRLVWSERPRSTGAWLERLEADLQGNVMALVRGGEFDRWDLGLRLGPLAYARLRMAIEEHGEGRQLLRFRVWPVWSASVVVLLAVLLAGAAFNLTRDVPAAAVLGFAAVALGGRSSRECGAAVASFADAIARLVDDPGVAGAPTRRRAPGADVRLGCFDERASALAPAYSVRTLVAAPLEVAEADD